MLEHQQHRLQDHGVVVNNQDFALVRHIFKLVTRTSGSEAPMARLRPYPQEFNSGLSLDITRNKWIIRVCQQNERHCWCAVPKKRLSPSVGRRSGSGELSVHLFLTQLRAASRPTARSWPLSRDWKL